MNRSANNELISWKNLPAGERKPLIVQGARQVGKTYLIKEFAKAEFQDAVFFNFEETPDLRSLFQSSLKPEYILESLGAFAGRRIDPLTTLVFFDEIQACERALTSLKYFCEEMPGAFIIAAGSLLGVSVGRTSGFPVGKVSFLTMRPLSFFEYLDASGETLLREMLGGKKDFAPVVDAFHNRLMNAVRYYLFLGGMPAVVRNYLNHRDIQNARRIQKEILEAYGRDFAKYSTASEAIRISEIWQSIPFHLARENKKFMYSTVRKGARASTFESAVEWLRSAGLIHRASGCTTAAAPLRAHADTGKFKVYLLDTGLMGAMVDSDPSAIVSGDRILSDYCGALTENFVATELVSGSGPDLHYWRSDNIAEVDFILQKGTEILPLEVKSGMARNVKSLRVFAEKFHCPRIYRTSPRNFTLDNDCANIPLYAVSLFPGLS